MKKTTTRKKSKTRGGKKKEYGHDVLTFLFAMPREKDIIKARLFRMKMMVLDTMSDALRKLLKKAKEDGEVSFRAMAEKIMEVEEVLRINRSEFDGHKSMQ